MKNEQISHPGPVHCRWIGEVSAENMNKTLLDLERLALKENTEEVTLAVTSRGGDIDIGFAFYDSAKLFERDLKCTLTTIAVGGVHSAALLVWLAGSRRFITSHTLMYFHEARRPVKGDVQLLSDMQGQSRWLELQVRIGLELAEKATGGKLKKAMLREFLERQETLTAGEALRLGLAHAIVEI